MLSFGDEDMGRDCGRSEQAKGRRQWFSVLRFCLFLSSGCLLFWQVGCQGQAKLTEGDALQKGVKLETIDKSEAELTASKPLVDPEKDEATPEAPMVAGPRPGKSAPKIEFDKVVHDFGEVGPGTKRVGEFKFTNTGSGLLRITKVDRCCGFSTRLSKNEYVPGESGTLIAEYHSGPRTGTMIRKIVVHSNDEERPDFALTVKAKIVERVAYEPKRLNLSPKEANAGCPKIALTSLDNQPFSIVGFKSTANCITVDHDSSSEATKFVCQPTVNMERLRRGLNGVVEIRLTHPECDRIAIPFTTLTEFKISPPQITILNAEPQKPVTRKVSVLSNYGEDFEVESASSKNDFVKVKSQQKTHNGYQFEVEITPPVREGKRESFVDVFSVNIKAGEKLAVVCRGFYPKKKTYLEVLNEGQKAYMDWTESNFASLLNRNEYASLSNSTKRELEQMWTSFLEGPRNQKYYDAINCLAAIESKRAVKPLLRIATERGEKDNRARWMAVRALGIIYDESVVPELIHLVYHYHQNTRFWAQISLVRLTGVNFGYDWQQWGEWWNREKGKPLFSVDRITWTQRADWADEDNQREKDRVFLDRLEGDRKDGPAT